MADSSHRMPGNHCGSGRLLMVHLAGGPLDYLKSVVGAVSSLELALSCDVPLNPVTYRVNPGQIAVKIIF